MKGVGNLTDTEWISLVKASPHQGYRALIDQYGNLVYAIVLSKLKGTATREDIEDCVSDIFTELFRNAESFNPACGTLKDYLSTIAKRTAIDAYRRLSKRYSSTASIEDDEIILPPSEDNPEKETESRLSVRRIWDAVKCLGEPDSSIIIRQYFYEQTAREIARALSMTAAAVQKRSVRARKRLKEILEAEFSYNGKGDCCEKA